MNKIGKVGHEICNIQQETSENVKYILVYLYIVNDQRDELNRLSHLVPSISIYIGSDMLHTFFYSKRKNNHTFF